MVKRSSTTMRSLGLLCSGPLAMLTLLAFCSPSLADETVQVCGSYANNVFAASTVPRDHHDRPVPGAVI